MKSLIKKTVLATALLLPLASYAETIIGLKENGDLIAFDSATPSTVRKVLTPTGLAGDQLVSIDFRPATGALYLVAKKATSTTDCQLYTISPTGVVTAVGAVYVCDTVKDIDFNPVADKIRVISDNENYRVDPVTGVRATPSDTAPAFAVADVNGGDPVSVIGSAYSNNTSGTLSTALYVIDDTNDVLALVATPNIGELTTIGPLGTTVGFSTAFDISGAGAGNAYLFKYNFGLNIGQLYTVNLGTGAATLAGQVGSGNLNLLGMTVAPISLVGGASAAAGSSSGGASGVTLLLGLAGLGWWRRRAVR